MNPAPPIERERYEFRENPFYTFPFDRRGFLRSIGGGIAVVLVASPRLAAQARRQQQGESGGRDTRSERGPHAISAWLHIQPDGSIHVFTGKVEIGQNIRTSLAQTVADELRVPLDAVALTMGDTLLTPFDMGTFGSRSTPQMGTELRRAAAAARDVLVRLAARQWHVDPAQLAASDGRVGNHDGLHATYAELARNASLAEIVPNDEPVTPAVDWTIAGHSRHKQGAETFVTGRHKYTPDLKLPGMLYGKIVRPAAFGATLVSADTTAARALPGVTVVQDGDFLGVAAPDELTAERAAAAIHSQWKTTPQPSSRELFTYLKQHAEPESGNRDRQEKGSMGAGLAAAAHRLQATFDISYIAHCPLEPRAALAQWNGSQVTVWTGSQRPFAVQQQLAQAFHLGDDSVRVIVPDTGAAFGGKHTGEQAVEAARLARAAGKPVHLLWTREEEFTWAYFRPAGVIEIRSGVDADGKLTAWEFHNYNSGPAAIATMYDVPNQLIEFHPCESPLRQGSYRSLAACANHFARESHMDELAHAADLDPLEFRMRNLSHPRLRAVYEAATKEFNWTGRRKSPGRGFGLAGGIEKGGHIATCAEVAVDPTSRTVQILRVVQAFDCGAVVNPDELKNSIAGAITQGIGGALYEAITFDNGRILNPHFAQYRVPRFHDVPDITVVLVDRKDEPSFGAGETPIVGIAPAVANAIFDATGQRLRTLPMLPSGKLA